MSRRLAKLSLRSVEDRAGIFHSEDPAAKHAYSPVEWVVNLEDRLWFACRLPLGLAVVDVEVGQHDPSQGDHRKAGCHYKACQRLTRRIAGVSDQKLQRVLHEASAEEFKDDQKDGREDENDWKLIERYLLRLLVFGIIELDSLHCASEYLARIVPFVSTVLPVEVYENLGKRCNAHRDT